MLKNVARKLFHTLYLSVGAVCFLKGIFMAFCRRWCWVMAFCLVTSFVYAQSMKKKKSLFAELTFRLDEMEKERKWACLEKEHLQLKIASQDDPSWIEMILMRDLGVVPEGYLKVHFRGK